MAVTKKDENARVSVKSIIDSTLIHSGLEIEAFEVVSVTKELADELIATGYCKLVKVKEV